MTEDESRHSYEIDDRYVILPEYISWELEERRGSTAACRLPLLVGTTTTGGCRVDELREMCADVTPALA